MLKDSEDFWWLVLIVLIAPRLEQESPFLYWLLIALVLLTIVLHKYKDYLTKKVERLKKESENA